MRNLILKELTAALVAGAALAIATPDAMARERHHPRGHAVVRTHHGKVVIRGFHHRFKPGLRLTAGHLKLWRGGHWWHGKRHGKLGWWWWAGNTWYWYPAAVYPYPTEVSAEAVYDYAPEGMSDDSWYYCDDPEGYYPYVRTCNSEWKPVPISPQASADSGYAPPGEDVSDEDADSEDMDDEESDDSDE